MWTHSGAQPHGTRTATRAATGSVWSQNGRSTDGLPVQGGSNDTHARPSQTSLKPRVPPTSMPWGKLMTLYGVTPTPSSDDAAMQRHSHAAMQQHSHDTATTQRRQKATPSNDDKAKPSSYDTRTTQQRHRGLASPPGSQVWGAGVGEGPSPVSRHRPDPGLTT
jgi:hypothetical protein